MLISDVMFDIRRDILISDVIFDIRRELLISDVLFDIRRDILISHVNFYLRRLAASHRRPLHLLRDTCWPRCSFKFWDALDDLEDVVRN